MSVSKLEKGGLKTRHRSSSATYLYRVEKYKCKYHKRINNKNKT